MLGTGDSDTNPTGSTSGCLPPLRACATAAICEPLPTSTVRRVYPAARRIAPLTRSNPHRKSEM